MRKLIVITMTVYMVCAVLTITEANAEMRGGSIGLSGAIMYNDAGKPIFTLPARFVVVDTGKRTTDGVDTFSEIMVPYYGEWVYGWVIARLIRY